MLIARAATLDVCPSGCAYAHIQDAIDAAAPSPGPVPELGSGELPALGLAPALALLLRRRCRVR